MKTLLIDSSRCIQCCNCQIACKDEHCDNDWSPIARPQGEDQSWIRIEQSEAGSETRIKVFRLPVICQHCTNPVCAHVVPGAVYVRPDGYVIIDPDKARGHREIVDACPYGAIYWNEELSLPQKCTMCAHLLDEGRERPRCVAACPTDALRFVDEEELAEENLYAPLERLHPEYGTKPKVAYLNLPKPFCGGSLVDQDGNSVIGASVVLLHQLSRASWDSSTDAFGDFSFAGIKPGFYTLTFEKDGFARKDITNLDLREAKNVGDVRFNRLKLAMD